MNSHIIYHPKRDKKTIGDLLIYHDSFGNKNEDPYLWNDNFLHTYCHITQLKNIIGQINFWVSGDTYPNFAKLFCDCVFVIEKKIIWKNANNIKFKDPIVDNKDAFDYHYKWHTDHPFKKKKRYTLKANSETSFQPQDINKQLIDIVPFLNSQGLTTHSLVESISMTISEKKARNSRPFKLDDVVSQKLYDFLFTTAKIKIYGKQLIGKHP